MRAVHGYDGAQVGLPPAKAAGGRSSAVVPLVVGLSTVLPCRYSK